MKKPALEKSYETFFGRDFFTYAGYSFLICFSVYFLTVIQYEYLNIISFSKMSLRHFVFPMGFGFTVSILLAHNVIEIRRLSNVLFHKVVEDAEQSGLEPASMTGLWFYTKYFIPYFLGSLGVVFPLATFHMTYVLGIEFSDLSSVHYFIPLIVSAVFGYQLSMIVVYRKKLERQNLFLVIKEEELLDLNLNLENIAMKRAGKIIELEHLANDILNSQESIVLLSDEKKLIRVNDKFYELFSDFYSLNDFLAKHNSISEFFINNPEGDYLEKEVNGMSWLEFASKNTKTNHHVLIKYHGVKKYYDVTAKELSSDDQKLYVATFTDITSLVSYRMQLEEYSEKIKKQLFTDALTGLPNRLKLLEDIKSYHLSVITLNIDSFQELNNYFGNDVGDEILAEVSERINEKINHDAAINQYRIGGDIYAITFVKSMHKDVLIAYAEELSDAVAGKNLKQKMISNLPFL